MPGKTDEAKARHGRIDAITRGCRDRWPAELMAKGVAESNDEAAAKSMAAGDAAGMAESMCEVSDREGTGDCLIHG